MARNAICYNIIFSLCSESRTYTRFVLQIPVTIDRSSPVPLYHQLYEQLSAAIETGRLKPGDAFENELALADRLQLSRPTVRRSCAARRSWAMKSWVRWWTSASSAAKSPWKKAGR